MKSSARNQFKGTITSTKPGAINDEVHLELEGGDTLVATVTHESAVALGLLPGREALALVKAPWVVLTTEAEGYRFSSRNCLKGEVAEVERGAVNTEVVVRLAGGTGLVAIVTRASADDMDLHPGTRVLALIKASHVLLAVKD